MESETEINTINRNPGTIYALAISPDGKLLVSGDGENTVKVWSFEDFREILTLKGESIWVGLVKFSPDGRGPSMPTATMS